MSQRVLNPRQPPIPQWPIENKQMHRPRARRVCHIFFFGNTLTQHSPWIPSGRSKRTEFLPTN